MINAGIIDIKLKPTKRVKVNSVHDLRSYAIEEEYGKLDLLLKLDGSCISTSAIYFKTDTLCSIPIHVNMADISNHYEFLDLMSYVNRSTQPGEFLSVFDDTTTFTNNTSLLDIFIHLPSPQVDNQLSNWCEDKDILEFLFKDIQVQVPGMKTTLYVYQKHSLWKILQRELAPLTTEKYQVIRLIDVDSTPYYFDQLTGEITLSTEHIPDVKGGIICEDMGTGKTCICLATIMATKDLSNPFMEEFYENLETDLPLVKHKSIQSLKSTCTEKVLRLGINWKPVKYQLPFDVTELLQKYPMYYKWTDIPINYQFERSRRIQPNFTTLTVYLSNATLVVVPDNLVAQWSGEIYKHIFDGQLKFVTYDDDSKQPILPPIQLADYDLVLISQNRFSQENTKGGLDFKSRSCQCPSIRSTREERACVCSLSDSETYISPLLQVHWKRLIVDEGHRLSSKNRQSQLSSKLFSNWKWICTGTPTQNLTESASMRTRQESESDDLNRLGTLFGQALNLEPFKSNKKLWHRIISKPFLNRKPWAIAKLANIMERTMIRNRRGDIEKEVTLPPLHQKIIYLDFDYYQWLAHNCQIAMISLNAILSKREGADYLFSPKNFKSLRETVHNLWQSCLWHSVDLELAQKALENCIEACTYVEQGRSDYGAENKDLWRIRDVLHHALNDTMFTCMMTHHSPSYVVQGLPNLFKEAWGWLKGDHGVYYNASGTLLPWDDYCVVEADKIIDAMSIVTSTRDEFTNLFVYNGSDHSLKSVQEFQQAKKQSSIQKKKKSSSTSEKSLPGTNKEEEKEEKEEKKPPDQLTFYTRNAFSDAKVLSSSSGKINYLVNQVYRYQATEKCIIFSQHYNEMYEIYLALQLAKIRVLMYQDSRMNNAKRSQMILTFNTSDNANVIIMAVQKAAYGIDLSSATRVFFVSPVWQTAMEQQAIKRAHRIGQTKPVFIETLVIKNTIEHRLLERRDQVGSSDSGQQDDEDKENLKRGDFFTDSKLKNILNHAYFVPLPDTITKDEKTGSYRQKIEPLDAPLYFIPPPKKVEEEQQQVSEEESVVNHKTVLFTDDDHLSDVEVDEEDDIMVPGSSPPPTSNALTISDSKRRLSSSGSEEDDMMLDIVGDEDVMDAIQPWKMRLLQLDKKKRKREHQTATATATSLIEEEPSKKKRPKKSVRFA